MVFYGSLRILTTAISVFLKPRLDLCYAQISTQAGAAIGYDQSQSDRGRFSATKQSDLNIIRIGQERYEIPDAVIFGG